MFKKIFITTGFILLFFVSCDSGKVKIKIQDGQEGGDCYNNGTCDDGLICDDGKCVEDLSKDDTDSGNTSDDGDTGNSGNTGNTGDSGNTGDTGNSGNTGNTGDTGNTGNSGDTGNSGNSGDSGNTGDTGNTGNTVFDPCDPNPCTAILNSDGDCIPEESDFICGCNTGFKWDGSICKSHNEFILVTSGGYHTCGINYDQKLRCWGGNVWGQLGINSTQIKCSPEKVDDYQWITVSAGNEHTCGIRKVDNKLYCWGKNNFGEIAQDPEKDHSEIPMMVGNLTWKSVSCGSSSSCGIDSNDHLYCWGKGGTVGDGTIFDKFTPVKISSGEWKMVSAGGGHSCGIGTDDKLYCWGGGVGNTPTKINDDIWIAVSAGNNGSTCGIKGDNKLYCWGDNYFGQLGINSTDDQTTPTKVNDDEWIKIDLASDHTCGIKKSDNSLYCWGSNQFGQIGDGTGGSGSINNKLIPTLVNFKGIILSAGGKNTCGNDKNEKELYCWGQNNAGQVGTGTCDSLNHASPVRVEFTY